MLFQNLSMFMISTIFIVLVYLLPYDGMCLSAPIDNTTISSGSEPALLNETIGMVFESNDEELLADYRKETLPEFGGTDEAGHSKGPEMASERLDRILEPLFISKEESNNFLSRQKRSQVCNRGRCVLRGTPVKRRKVEGPLEYDEMETYYYSNFQYQFPSRAIWWPTDEQRGAKLLERCYPPGKPKFCEEWGQIYNGYYVKGWKEETPFSFELASVIFRFLHCARGQATDDYRYNCPKPCASNPCSGRHMTRCVVKGARTTLGYYCECERGWNYNPTRRRCDDVNVCRTPLSRCVAANTLRCAEGIGLAHTCECKVQWMGNQCEQQYDACIDLNNPCGTHGMCRAHRGQQTWTCDCDAGWGDDPEHRGRDCNKRDNPCENLICRNGGECQRAGSQSTTAWCRCPDTYKGDMCEERNPQWNEWMPWSDCDVTCGTGGQKARTRNCDHAGAAYCGGGADNEEMSCSGPICLVDGEWGTWSQMTSCSHNCGGGKYLRARNCEYDNDDPDTFGETCKGEILSYEDCNVMTCPQQVKRKTMVDIESLARSVLAETGIAEGDWGAWNSWTTCTESCGTGFQQRGRTCLNALGTCEGDSEEFQDCFEIEECESENEFLPWSSWSVWSMCGPMTPTCTRTRHCPYGENDPASTKACPGDGTDEAPCRYNSCTGEGPATLVDVAHVMGGDSAVHAQMGNMQAAGIHPNSYLNAAAPGFVAAPVQMGPGVPNMHGYPVPPPGHQPKYEKEAKSAAGSLGGLVFIAILICVGCCVKKKAGSSESSGSGYQTKSRVTGDDF